MHGEPKARTAPRGSRRASAAGSTRFLGVKGHAITIPARESRDPLPKAGSAIAQYRVQTRLKKAHTGEETP